MSTRKVILYISMSLDGYIATQDDGLNWLSIVAREGEDYGYGQLMKHVDTYIVGRRTYDTVLKLTGGVFPQAETLRCYVLSRQQRDASNGVNFYNGNINELIQKLKQEKGKNIYCDGGAEIVKLFMQHDLIDEYIISVIPIFLGDGKRLFLGGLEKKNLKAKPCTYFESGLVQLRYERA